MSLSMGGNRNDPFATLLSVRTQTRGRGPMALLLVVMRGREQALLHTAGGNIEARDLLGRALAINPNFCRGAGIFRRHPCDRLRQWLGRHT
jgi:hypothetical protein